jgi:hypothetical protein
VITSYGTFFSLFFAPNLFQLFFVYSDAGRFEGINKISLPVNEFEGPVIASPAHNSAALANVHMLQGKQCAADEFVGGLFGNYHFVSPSKVRRQAGWVATPFPGAQI